MANYASVHANSNYLENIMDSHQSPNNFNLNNDISKELMDSGRKNSKDIKNFNLLDNLNEKPKDIKNINKAATLEEDEYKEIELDENGCQSFLPPHKSSHWCESEKKCMKLSEKCTDWETDINIILKQEKERLDLDKMKIDDNSLFINTLEQETDNSIDLNQYGFIESILLLIVTLGLLIFLVRNHR
jgi:hypothetical protein